MAVDTPQFSEKRSKFGEKAAIRADLRGNDRYGSVIQNSITEIVPQSICNGLILYV
jgi:hypothetical protein